MTIEKAQIISGVYEQQAIDATEAAKAVQAEVHEFAGAEKALRLMAQQMPEFARNIEARIESDEELGKAADSVRVYSRNIIARFQAMCESNAKHQLHCKFRAEGKLQALVGLSETLKKRGEKEVAVAKRREEVDEENRAKRAKEEADEVMENITKKNGKSNGVKKTRKTKTETAAKKRAPRKKPAPRKSK